MNNMDLINIQINVSEIDKNKLFEGKKGKYLNAVLIPTPGNQYGNDYMIVQSITKEERERGDKGKVLGNAKIHVKQEAQVDAPATSSVGDKVDSNDSDGGGLPF